jgi:hypothetical protein
MANNSTRDAVEVSWPTTAGLELVGSLVERRFTACASVDALVRIMLIELS